MAKTVSFSHRLKSWVAELLEELGIVLHEVDDDAPERFVVLDPGVLLPECFLAFWYALVTGGALERHWLLDILVDRRSPRRSGGAIAALMRLRHASGK